MIAIVQTGAKQYQVKKGDKITVEKLPQAAGEKVEFLQVLMITDDNAIKVGTPTIPKAKVLGKLIKNIKGPKLIHFKHRRRENMRRKKGHRQNLSEVLIEEIVTG